MKTKAILIIAGSVLVVGLVIWFNALINENKRLKTDNNRLSSNQTALLDREKHYVSLNLKQSEALKAKDLKIDSISELLKIKPKTIERIVFKTIIQHDTTEKTVFVEKQGLNFWKIKDSDKCYTWQGTARLFKDSLTVIKTRFDYNNPTIDAFWKSRRFWIFSKWKYYQEGLVTCGASYTKEILIKKK